MAKPKLYTHAEVIETYVGKLIQLQCFNTFKPEPERVWSKTTGEMPGSNRIKLQYSKSVLMISGAKHSDSGKYLCSAGNYTTFFKL